MVQSSVLINMVTVACGFLAASSAIPPDHQQSSTAVASTLSPAAPGIAPFACNLRWELDNDVRICGATLLTDSWLVSHGSCVDKLSNARVFQHDVQCGITDRFADLATEQVRTWSAADVIVHPNRSRFVDNIALIRVSHPFLLNDVVRPICLRSADYVDNNVTARIFSWEDRNEEPENWLQTAALDILDAPSCRIRMDSVSPQSTKFIHDNHLCVAGDTYPKCRREGGAPVVRKENGVDVMIGMILWGLKNCRLSPQLPISCARMSAYTKWIEEQVGEKLSN